MAGIPRLNTDLSITVFAKDGGVIDKLPPDALTRGGIGYFYERIVGLHYERAGYLVEYRNCLGYLDRGVDLIAHKEMQRRFIQCKFTLKPMPSAKVELLLSAASSFVSKNLGPRQNYFDLAVPFENLAFPERRHSKTKPGGSANLARLSFQRYNTTQSQIRLRMVEIPIEVPELLLVNHAA